VVIKRQMPGDVIEFKQYFQHKNLQGSTNLVTDENALVFENLLHFPGGEIWVHEKSTEFPTPYRYGGGYYDEFRDVINFGDRWYEPRDQVFYSADPILQDDPTQVIGDPALLPAYTYAESNPLSLVDPGGRKSSNARRSLSASFIGVHRANPPAAAQTAAAQGDLTDTADRGSRLWAPLQAFQDSARRKAYKDFNERFDLKPLLEIDFKKTSDGWKLDDVKAGFFWAQKSLLKSKQNDKTANGAGESDSPNSVPMPDAARTNGPGAGGDSAATGGLASPVVPDTALDTPAGVGNTQSAPHPPAAAP